MATLGEYNDAVLWHRLVQIQPSVGDCIVVFVVEFSGTFVASFSEI